MSNKTQICNIEISQLVVGEVEELTCNARDLHARLEVGNQFQTWFKDRVETYGFVEGLDFVAISVSSLQEFFNQVNLTPVPHGGDRRSIEYHLTTTMAAELAMIEKSPVGKVVRLGFIAAAKELRQIQKAQAALQQTKVLALESALGREFCEVYTNTLEVTQNKLNDIQTRFNDLQLDLTQNKLNDIQTRFNDLQLDLSAVNDELAMYKGQGRKDATFKRLLDVECENRALKSALLSQESEINRAKLGKRA